ncbi:MAG TPA: PAS domain-containing protein [Candidatus Thermoplasmatota archaeon]|nr:PAS domain-containing protein [Candidatus Thermoplasmatota archaeon]
MAERQTPEGDALIGAVLSSVSEGVLEIDLSGKIAFANPAALRLLGYAAEDLRGKAEHDVLHAARADGAAYPPDRCPILGTIADGSVHHAYGEVFRRRDGSTLAVEYTCAPLRRDGRPVGAAVIFQEARPRGEDAERRAREKAMRVYEALPDAYVQLDRDWRVTYLNPAAHRMRPRGDVVEPIGRSIWDAYPALAGTQFETEMRRAMKDRVTVVFESQGPLIPGWFHVTAIPTEDGLAFFVRDVTALHAAHETARESVIDRPLARRIVQDLVETGGVPHQVLTQVGRNLATTQPSGSLEDAVHSFSEMGLGTLRMEKAEGQRYSFSGNDLLERRPGSRVATCSFTLGYLAEAVSRVHANEPTLGTEIECQSRGAKECKFVVQVKKPEEGLARRVKELV